MKTVILFTEHGSYRNQAGESLRAFEISSDTNVASNHAIVYDGKLSEAIEKYNLEPKS